MSAQYNHCLEVHVEHNPSLTYHQATFDLISEKPVVSRWAVEVLDLLEQSRGIVLPASVRELYSLEGAVNILNRFPLCGYAREVERLGDTFRYWLDASYHEVDLLEQDLLWIMRELQGVYSWAVHLNGSDDPPVVVAIGNETPVPFTRYYPYIETFSAFVYTRAWDEPLVADDQLFGWRRGLLSSAELAFFRAHFQEGPLTHLAPSLFNRRFFTGNQRILIHEAEGETDWYFYALTNRELKQLVETVLRCDTLKGEMHLDRNGLAAWEDMFPEENP